MRKGQTFRRFVHALKRYGYRVEWNELRACDYGAPTIRKRFFLIARCDGLPIVWPEPTHGDPSTLFVASGILHPWRTAAEIIDWTIPCPSIYDRKKPLCENTMRRIARGLRKFVLEHPQPYIVDDHIAPFLIQYHTEQSGKEVRGQAVDKPLMTADSSNRYGLVTALLIKYYGQGEGQSLREPLHTITVKDRFGLVIVRGEPYQIIDIGLRMLTPRELFRAQGFPEDYIIDRDADGKHYPKSAQVARCGNAVPPPFAEALVRANLPEMCGEEERESA